MRVQLFSSLGAKLFYMSAALLLVAICAISYFNANAFHENLQNQIRDSLQAQSKDTAQELNSELDRWASTLNLFVNAVGNNPNRTVESTAADLLKSDPELIAMGRYSEQFNRGLVWATRVEGDAAGEKFESYDPKSVLANLKPVVSAWAQTLLKQDQDGRSVFQDWSDVTPLPIMGMAVVYGGSGGIPRQVAVLLVWKHRLVQNLPKGAFQRTAVVYGDSFRSLIHTVVEREAWPDFRQHPVVALATSSATPGGYRDSYLDRNQQTWLGAFHRLADKNMLIIVERDADQAFSAISRIITRNALWGLLAMMLAILVSYFGAEHITSNLRKVVYATEQIAGGNFQTSIQIKSHDEVQALGESVNAMAQQIQGLMKLRIEQARLEKELETARMVQSTFFPRASIARDRGIEITGFYEPAAQCGGDWWGHIRTDDGLDYIFIADAMGHGVPSALVTAMAYANCMTVAQIIQERSSHRDSPKEILERFNRMLFEAVQGTISMTFFTGIIDSANGTLTYANAGHNFPILLTRASDDKRVKRVQKSLVGKSEYAPITIRQASQPLGVEADSAYSNEVIQLRQGDRLVLYTDGLIEGTNHESDAFGRRRLIRSLLQHAGANPQQMKEEVVQAAFRHFAGKPLLDDVTLVIVDIQVENTAVPAPLNSVKKAG